MKRTTSIALAPERGTVRNAKRNATYRVSTVEYASSIMPRHFTRFLPPAHSWEAHVTRMINGTDPQPHSPSESIALRPYQDEAVRAVCAAYTRGARGFPLAYPTGSGKTIITIEAMNRLDVSFVCVIVPRSHVGGWRRAISTYSRDGIEWVVTTPDRMDALLTCDGLNLAGMNAKAVDDVLARYGRAFERFDCVVVDESHVVANPSSMRSAWLRSLVGWDRPDPSFLFTLSATPWTNPMETSVASYAIAEACGVNVPNAETIHSGYFEWLKERGLSLRKLDGFHWRYEHNARDVEAIREWVFGGGRGLARTASELGLPAQPRELYLIELDEAERAAYELSWSEFWATRDPSKIDAFDPDSALVEQLRNVQKASVILVPHIAARVAEAVDAGYSVIVPAWFSETIDEFRRLLTAAGVSVTTITGAQTAAEQREHQRAFQTGAVDVVVTSVTQSIDLHATDENPRPRRTIFGDVLTGGKRTYQAEGRGSRDGQVSDAIYPVAMSTGAQKWLASVFSSLADTRALSSVASILDEPDIISFSTMSRELSAMVESQK